MTTIGPGRLDARTGEAHCRRSRSRTKLHVPAARSRSRSGRKSAPIAAPSSLRRMSQSVGKSTGKIGSAGALCLSCWSRSSAIVRAGPMTLPSLMVPNPHQRYSRRQMRHPRRHQRKLGGLLLPSAARKITPRDLRRSISTCPASHGTALSTNCPRIPGRAMMSPMRPPQLIASMSIGMNKPQGRRSSTSTCPVSPARASYNNCRQIPGSNSRKARRLTAQSRQAPAEGSRALERDPLLDT